MKQMKIFVTVEMYPIAWENLKEHDRNIESITAIYRQRLQSAISGETGLPTILINSWRSSTLNVEILD